MVGDNVLKVRSAVALLKLHKEQSRKNCDDVLVR
jgi:hypothetical protein